MLGEMVLQRLKASRPESLQRLRMPALSIARATGRPLLRARGQGPGVACPRSDPRDARDDPFRSHDLP